MLIMHKYISISAETSNRGVNCSLLYRLYPL
jgi:hypothetical protein